MFKGCFTALVTPFSGDDIDWVSFENLIEWQIEQGINGLVPCGTTGESPTLTHAEHREAVSFCVEKVRGRVPVIAGAGSNSTAEALELAEFASQVGADAALVVIPYYNKPNQVGLLAHYSKIAQSVDIPLIIYNIPSRSVIEMSVETMAKLAKLPTIVGVKDSTANLDRVSAQISQCGADFCQLSGEDASAVDFNRLGGHGIISVTSNIAPALVSKVQALCLNGEFDEAAKLHERLMPLHDILFCEPSPAPAKFALSLMARCSAVVRLPLAGVSVSAQSQIKKILTDLDLTG